MESNDTTLAKRSLMKGESRRLSVKGWGEVVIPEEYQLLGQGKAEEKAIDELQILIQEGLEPRLSLFKFRPRTLRLAFPGPAGQLLCHLEEGSGHFLWALTPNS
jgi:hypothetical protein